MKTNVEKDIYAYSYNTATNTVTTKKLKIIRTSFVFFFCEDNITYTKANLGIITVTPLDCFPENCQYSAYYLEPSEEKFLNELKKLLIKKRGELAKEFTELMASIDKSIQTLSTPHTEQYTSNIVYRDFLKKAFET